MPPTVMELCSRADTLWLKVAFPAIKPSQYDVDESVVFHGNAIFLLRSIHSIDHFKTLYTVFSEDYSIDHHFESTETLSHTLQFVRQISIYK